MPPLHSEVQHEAPPPARTSMMRGRSKTPMADKSLGEKKSSYFDFDVNSFWGHSQPSDGARAEL